MNQQQQQSTGEVKRYMYEIGLYEWLSKDIEKETNQITAMVNLVQKYRYAIKYDIGKIAYEVFHQLYMDVEAHIYGSVATDLALLEVTLI